jgi:hypothetical protein
MALQDTRLIRTARAIYQGQNHDASHWHIPLPLHPTQIHYSTFMSCCTLAHSYACAHCHIHELLGTSTLMSCCTRAHSWACADWHIHGRVHTGTFMGVCTLAHLWACAHWHIHGRVHTGTFMGGCTVNTGLFQGGCKLARSWADAHTSTFMCSCILAQSWTAGHWHIHELLDTGTFMGWCTHWHMHGVMRTQAHSWAIANWTIRGLLYIRVDWFGTFFDIFNKSTPEICYIPSKSTDNSYSRKKNFFTTQETPCVHTGIFICWCHFHEINFQRLFSVSHNIVHWLTCPWSCKDLLDNLYRFVYL